MISILIFIEWPIKDANYNRLFLNVISPPYFIIEKLSYGYDYDTWDCDDLAWICFFMHRNSELAEDWIIFF